MYYWECGAWGLPLFWKENGMPVFVGSKRLSRRRLVWWMPVNWLVVLVCVLLAPFNVYRHWRASRRN
jgi:hypothetical protein